MKLRTWLDDNGLTAEEFSREVDSSVHAVHAWARGIRRPSKSKMPLIVRATKGAVTPNDFFDVLAEDAA